MGEEVLWASEQGGSRKIVKSFHQTLAATQALMCSLAGVGPGKCICVLQREDCIKVYSPDGAEFEVALPCRAAKMWALPQGLLIERSTKLSEALDLSRSTLYGVNEQQRMDFEHDVGLATLLEESRIDPTGPMYFSLLHPLEELKPVSYSDAHRATSSSRVFFSEAGDDVDFMCDADEKIVYCGDVACEGQEITLIVTYHSAQGMHSVWSLLPSESFATETAASVRQGREKRRQRRFSPDQGLSRAFFGVRHV